MDPLAFEDFAQHVYDSLPEPFLSRIDNVRIVIEDYPSDDVVAQRKLRSRTVLLGLYQGVPRPHRNTWYGTSPVMPDTITLYRKNLEAISATQEELERQIRITLMHEIGHYFGMSEEEIRAAGY